MRLEAAILAAAIVAGCKLSTEPVGLPHPGGVTVVDSCAVDESFVWGVAEHYDDDAGVCE